MPAVRAGGDPAADDQWYRAIVRIGQAVGAEDPSDANAVEAKVRERLGLGDEVVLPHPKPVVMTCPKCGAMAGYPFSRSAISAAPRMSCKACGYLWTDGDAPPPSTLAPSAEATAVAGTPAPGKKKAQMVWNETDPLVKYEQIIAAFGIAGLTLFISSENEYGVEQEVFMPVAARELPNGRALYDHVGRLPRHGRTSGPRRYKVRVREGRDADRGMLRILMPDDPAAEATGAVRKAGDAVDHPAHYNSNKSGVEAIDVVEWMSFSVGNAVKYCWRAGLKGDAIEDLRKAIWYLNREVDRLVRIKEGRVSSE
jgi:rubredoxin